MWNLRGLISSSSKHGKSHKVAAAAAITTSAIAYAEYCNEEHNNDEDNKYQNDLKIMPSGSLFPSLKSWNAMINIRNGNQSHSCQCEPLRSKLSLQRRSTIRRLNESSMPVRSLNAKYEVEWNNPLGEGAFSTVYVATKRSTNCKVAVKKIPKSFTDTVSFQKEIDALLKVQDNGGHPHICSLNETFEDHRNFYLVLDLVTGGEMFEHLITLGAYSEADAARLLREAAMALCFIHGIGIVHGDLKPENLMLSTDRSGDSSIQLVDFGCAHILTEGEESNANGNEDPNIEKKKVIGGNTPAYSPPEALVRTNFDPLLPSMDMWSLGIILYIMLTGLHPFDLYGNATDEAIEEQIKARKSPPLRDSPITEHLSSSAIDVIEKCITWNPNKRITAQQLLDHPWVTGETASEDKMTIHPFKSKLEAKVFADFFSWSNDDKESISKKTSLVERAFNSIDINNQGFLTNDDLKRHVSKGIGNTPNNANEDEVDEEERNKTLTLSCFSNLLGKNMKNKFFPRGKTVYREGDTGNHMYFINSGIIEVTTKHGSRVVRQQGDFFGEGALLHPKKIRSATIQCLTPVHAIEISREYFEKYMASSGLSVDLKEKDKTRKRNRAKTILRLQKNLETMTLTEGYTVFKEGEEANALYILESGLANIFVDDKKVFAVKPGDIFGEHSMIMGRPRNTSAICMSKECVVQEMKARDFYELYNSSSSIRTSLRELCLRREVQKALVKKTKKEFPSVNDLREVFDAADNDKTGFLNHDEVATLLLSFDPSLSEEEIKEVVETLDLNGNGKITFNEFRLIFGMDEARASSI